MDLSDYRETLNHIFVGKRKCIVNADLDGILAGMLLQSFLDWKVVGYSSCCGKQNDNLWLQNPNENLRECVFIDLPVAIPEYTVIDQHFVAFDWNSIERYNENLNKINPNIMRERVFSQYTKKYPFGTAHFVLAILEALEIIGPTCIFNFRHNLGGFDLADLILRADRVIGNTYQYLPNCSDWADWIMDLGRENTKALFSIVKNEYQERRKREQKVESGLQSLGCAGKDGDCSNLFRCKNYPQLNECLTYLSDVTGMNPLPVVDLFDYNNLIGHREQVSPSSKEGSLKDAVFSFAFVSKTCLSLTYIKENE